MEFSFKGHLTELTKVINSLFVSIFLIISTILQTLSEKSSKKSQEGQMKSYAYSSFIHYTYHPMQLCAVPWSRCTQIKTQPKHTVRWYWQLQIHFSGVQTIKQHPKRQKNKACSHCQSLIQRSPQIKPPACYVLTLTDTLDWFLILKIMTQLRSTLLWVWWVYSRDPQIQTVEEDVVYYQI